MLPIVILIIALGWAAFAVTWGRDRMRATSEFGLPPDPYATGRSRLFDAPRTEEAAQIRRQQVLAGLGIAAVLTFFMTRLWSIMWGLHILVDIALIAFLAAWYLRSSGGNLTRSEGGRSFGFNQPVPLADTDVARTVSKPVPVYAHASGQTTPAPVASGWVSSAPIS